MLNKTNYTANISYLTNIFIYEYDISKANINVLHSKGVIDKNTYYYLYNSERMARQKYVGMLCKDKTINNILKQGILEAKQMLFSTNDICDNDILSIKNDAVFVINKKLINTTFGLINFIMKNIYTSFYKLENLEVYYYYNNITREENIDIKGISDDKLKYHEGYFLEILKDILYSIQVNGPEITLEMIKDIYNEYISFGFKKEFYRSFDIESDYIYNFKSNLGTGFSCSGLNECDKTMLNIMRNVSILLQLNRIVTDMYFNKYR